MPSRTSTALADAAPIPESTGGRFWGEVRLLRTLLADGVETYLGPEGQEQREAARWIMSRLDAAGPEAFSFAFICRALGISPSWLRKRLRSLRAKQRIIRESTAEEPASLLTHAES